MTTPASWPSTDVSCEGVSSSRATMMALHALSLCYRRAGEVLAGPSWPTPMDSEKPVPYFGCDTQPSLLNDRRFAAASICPFSGELCTLHYADSCREMLGVNLVGPGQRVAKAPPTTMPEDPGRRRQSSQGSAFPVMRHSQSSRWPSQLLEYRLVWLAVKR